jgi:Tfp pilus assembly pilus retraction ATPase PilT
MQRIIDHVPLTVEQELTQRLANSIQNTLFQKLISGPGAPTEEKMKELLGEDPAVAARRELLQAKRDRLVEMKKRLDRFMD